MRTTLEIDEELLSKVMKATGEKKRSRAVDRALRDYLYWEAVKGLRAMAGKIEFDEEWLAQHRREHPEIRS